MVFLKLIDKMS